MKIQHCKNLSLLPDPVLRLLAMGWVSMLDSGIAPNLGLPFAWDQSVSWIESGGAVVSVIVWVHQEWDGSAWIRFGYTAPTERRKGLYSRLYADVRTREAALGTRAIHGATHVTNKKMQAVAAKQGRAAYAIQFLDVLPALKAKGAKR